MSYLYHARILLIRINISLMKIKLLPYILSFGLLLFFQAHTSLFAQQDSILNKNQEEEISPQQKVTATVVKEEPKPKGFTKNWFIGVKGGATFFISPLKNNPWSWGGAASLGKQLNSKTALRFDYLYGNLKSDGEFVRQMDDGSYYKNQLYSNVDFMEFALVLKLNLNDFFYSKSPKNLREFYFFGGGAYTMFRTKITDDNGDFVTGTGYSDTGDEESMEGIVAVPLGLGVTYKLGSKDIVNLNAEFGYRFVQSDELNGGLDDKASQYTFTSLGLLFNLGKPTISPQKITADRIKEELDKEMTEKLYAEADRKVKEETKPIKEDLVRQSLALAVNQEQIQILQEEMDARTNALQEQIAEGNVGNTSISGIDMTSVYFAFNSTYITPAMEREIAVIAKVLKKNKALKCTIIGNSSNIGSPEYNMQLSQKRAEAVMNLFMDEFKIAEDRLTLVNKGLEDPLAENLKKLNRRVDLIIE